MDPNSELLRPSLGSHDSPATAIYSVRTGYLSAFIGGPLAAAAVALVNANRLKRLGTDWPVAVLAVLASLGLAWWEIRAGGRSWLDGRLGRGGSAFVLRITGLAIFGVVYLMHRMYYRGMAVMGGKAPSGWVLGVGAAVAGILATAAIDVALAP